MRNHGHAEVIQKQIGCDGVIGGNSWRDAMIARQLYPKNTVLWLDYPDYSFGVDGDCPGAALLTLSVYSNTVLKRSKIVKN